MIPGDRTILHCDCNNFFASVELLDHPDLKGRPVAVAGDAEKRHGIILAKNMEAKAFGVQTAETLWQARQKCPDLILLPPRYPLYARFSRRINRIYLDYTDQVEPFSVDESWLDVTGSRRLFGDGETIAETLRARVREETGITISVGISFNKTWAKMGSDFRKPDAQTLLSRETGPALLYPLKLESMLFIGRSTAALLRSHGYDTIGDLVRSGEENLTRILGRSGGALYRACAGLDTSPVRVWGDVDQARSISHAETFSRDLKGYEDCERALLRLSEAVGTRLRHASLRAETVGIQIKDPSLHLLSRQKTLPCPTASTDLIYREACTLLRENWKADRPVRLLSVSLSRLVREGDEMPVQLSFLEDEDMEDPRRLQLEKAVDAVRNRLGQDSVTRGLPVRPASRDP